MVGPGRSSKALPKVKLASKKDHGHCLVVCYHLNHHSFLNPGKTITSKMYAQQINEMHQKLQCLQLALVNGKGPIPLYDNSQLHITQPMLQKLNELGYEVWPHPPYSSDFLPTIYHFFNHLERVNLGRLIGSPGPFKEKVNILTQAFLKPCATVYLSQGNWLFFRYGANEYTAAIYSTGENAFLRPH